MKFATKPIQPWEIKNSNLCRYSADMEENANKLHFKSPILINLCV